MIGVVVEAPVVAVDAAADEATDDSNNNKEVLNKINGISTNVKITVGNLSFLICAIELWIIYALTERKEFSDNV